MLFSLFPPQLPTNCQSMILIGDWAEPILTACYCKTFKNILYICDFIFDVFDIPGQKDKKNTFEFKLLKLSETLKPFTNIISTQKLLNHISPRRKTPLPQSWKRRSTKFSQSRIRSLLGPSHCWKCFHTYNSIETLCYMLNGHYPVLPTHSCK